MRCLEKSVRRTGRELADYAGAISERTRLILRVHPSNFRIVGFSSRPALEELVELAREHSLPLLEDVGGGCLVDLQGFGIQDEPNPRDSLNPVFRWFASAAISYWVDLRQASWLGPRILVERIRGNPLFRVLRVDKLTLSVLESTLISHLAETTTEDIPLMQNAASAGRQHRPACASHRQPVEAASFS